MSPYRTGEYNYDWFHHNKYSPGTDFLPLLQAAPASPDRLPEPPLQVHRHPVP